MRKMIAAATLAAGLAVAPAIGAVHAQDETVVEDDDEGMDPGLFGLIGLLGLAGLAGLKRRDRGDVDRSYGSTAGTTSTGMR